MNHAVSGLAGPDLAGPHLGDHRLAKLLAPQSIALVGASPKADSVGHGMIRRFGGAAITGARLCWSIRTTSEIEGIACYPSIAALPERGRPCRARRRQSPARGGSSAAPSPPASRGGDHLRQRLSARTTARRRSTRRIAAIARDAGMALCGGNGMGFYNLDTGSGLRLPAAATGSSRRADHPDHPFRLGCSARWSITTGASAINLAVSAGQELVTTAADYLDYALDQPTTRVVGLFLETVRDPAGFVAGAGEGARRATSRRRAQGRAHAGERGAGTQPLRRHRRQPRRLPGGIPPLWRDRGRTISTS